MKRDAKRPASADGAEVLVGLMSGTSTDGVTAAVVRFTEHHDGGVFPELLAYRSFSYTNAQRERLSAANAGTTPLEYTRLDFALGSWLADAAVTVMAEAGVARADIAAIASHGHTVWHDPPNGTWQIGQPAVIAERTGLPVISGFRGRDVAAMGQGAPLVPIADALLFSAAGHWRALQNIGGIGNVTVVPPRGAPRLPDSGSQLASLAGVRTDADPSPDVVDLAAVRAFDTGPGVVVMDAVTGLLFPGRRWDENGELALAGTAIEAAVDEMLEHPYFAAEPPKSTGRELFTSAYVARFVDRCRALSPACSNEDIVSTAVTLTARSIAVGISRFVPEPVAELVLSGGGAKNPALVAAIGREIAKVPEGPGLAALRVVLFDELFFDGEAKEAVAFAFLGWLHLRGRPGNVPTATGACGPRILGMYTPA